MKNLEIKVYCPAGFAGIKSRLSGSARCRRRGILHQTDTYFDADAGWRLKVREVVQCDRRHAELISYRRADSSSSRQSEYYVAAIADAASLIQVLNASLGGIQARVIKERELWIYEHTRIHLDTVEALGTFVEIETVMEEVSEGEAQAEHDSLRALLALDTYPALAHSYGDVAEFRKALHAI